MAWPSAAESWPTATSTIVVSVPHPFDLACAAAAISASSDRPWPLSRTALIASSTYLPYVQCRYTDHGRSEEHTSELQSRPHHVCRLLLAKKKLIPVPHSLGASIYLAEITPICI